MRGLVLLRIRLLAGAFILFGLLLTARLFHVAIAQGEAFRREADGQYVHTTRELYERGAIYFTDKNGNKVAAASQKGGYVLVVDPTKVTDAEKLYATLSKHVELPKDVFYMQVRKADDPYEEVAHALSEEQAEAVRALGLREVQLFREQWRHYPGGALAAQTLGFVGFDESGTKRSGRYGLERYWDDVLSREDSNLYVNFFAELFANIEDGSLRTRGGRAGDVVTSIDPSVQMHLEKVLGETETHWRSRELGGIIMNPSTGEVYALANLPTFDPNDYRAVGDHSRFSNGLVEGVREMGSIIKPIAMAIGLDTGAVSRSSTYDDTGSVVIDKYTIRNYDGRARGVVSMQEVLNQSLNVGIAHVTRQIGNKRFAERMRAFGIGEETGIDLPNEAHGLIDNLDSPRDVEYATASFGQGIAMTPIETVRALAALGNGGYLVTPHIVRELEFETGERSVLSFANDRERVLSEKASEEITRMLVEVVDSALRGGAVKKEHYSIAAKTGTAQIAQSGARGYYEDKYLHSFFGYFPAYEPRFIVFLYHVEPQGAQYASETLTDPFIRIVDYLINYYAIPPDR